MLIVTRKKGFADLNMKRVGKNNPWKSQQVLEKVLEMTSI